MTHLDLFSGIGGFALAAKWAGFETIGFSEIDPYAIRVLAKHWPNVPNFGDIRNVRGVSADLVTGGFPCTPFSRAGQRRGTKDDRYLWPEMLRVIAESEPAWVVCENVPELDCVALDEIISDLESIGHEVAPPFEIPACAIGADHIRNRLWILAYSDSASRKRRATREGLPGARRPELGLEDCNRDDVPAPGIPRKGHGIPNRTHRSRALGNSIVPQVAFQILKAIAAMSNVKPLA